MQEGWKKELIEWARSISFALIIVFVIKFFIFDIVAIDGISMQPTLYDKDRVFVSILDYEIGTPKCQDVIVFTPPVEEDSYFIKRVIGLPGDTVKISGGSVYVNDIKLIEPYIAPGTITSGDLILKVPEGMVFVLGDNRGNSEDSRYFGPISIKSIKGRAVYRVFPFSEMNKL